MIKFAVYSKVKFIKRPDWLNYFGKKYLKNDVWHVTLKQACYIERDQVFSIKQKLKELNKGLEFKNSKIDIKFNKIFVDEEKEDGGKTIMIRAATNKDILGLQKKVVALLGSYDGYCLKESRVWEKNFHPHITIASNLGEKEYAKAKRIMTKDYICEGVVDGFVFVREKNDGSKTRTNYKFI